MTAEMARQAQVEYWKAVQQDARQRALIAIPPAYRVASRDEKNTAHPDQERNKQTKNSTTRKIKEKVDDEVKNTFVKEKVDAEAYKLLAESDLKELGVPLGARKLLMKDIASKK